MQLMKAHGQWNSRPSDERFWNLDELFQAVAAHRDASVARTVDLKKLRVEACGGQIKLIGESGAQAGLTSWAFSQLAARAKAPAAYLAGLPATLAAQNINHGLKIRGEANEDAQARLLLTSGDGVGGELYARAITSEKYTRIWNAEIVSRLLGLGELGWVNPPAYVPWNRELGEMRTRVATAEDAKLSLTIQEGDTIAPAGLYASAEDMFAFLIQPEKIVQDGTEGGLMKGVMIWNSEVGKATFGISTFYFRGVCGNHIIWDAKKVFELNLRHVGAADSKAFNGIEVEMKKYADESVSDIESKIRVARTAKLRSASRTEVLDFVFGKKSIGLSRTQAGAAYDAVVEDVDGPAWTVWGFAQGLTRVSQAEPNADSRVALDRAAGKILEIVF